MALSVQVIFLSLCLATIGGGNANESAPSPAANTCCKALPPTPTSPCYVTTTAAPITCPFMPTTSTTTTSTNTTEQSVTSTTTETPSTTEMPLRPNFVMVPNYPNPMPAITPPLNYPYPILGPQGFMPVMTNPSTGQAYYLVPNPNKGYTQDRNTGGYYWMPAAVLPQSNNNSTTVKSSSDNN